MRLRLSYKTMIGVSLFALNAALQPAAAQTLPEALALTYETNPQLKAQRAQLRSTDQLRAQARAGRRPVIAGSADVTQTGGEFIPPDDFTALDSFDPATVGPLLDVFGAGADAPTTTLGISITQPLFQGFRVQNAIREADARVVAARARMLAAEQGLFTQTVQAYLSVGTARDSVSLSRTSVRLLSEQLEATQIRYDAGQTTRTDIAQSEARLAQGQAQLIQAEATLDAAELMFKRIVGQAPATLNTDMPLPALPATLEEALATANDQNLELIAIKAEADAAKYGVKSAKGALSPTLNATARYGRSYNQFIEGDEAENVSAGVQLTIPFYQGGREYAAIRQARYGETAARHNLEAVRRSVNEQTAAAWQNFLAAEAQYKAAEAAASANALAFKGVKLENEVGQRTTLEVLNAERENLDANLGLLRANQARYLSAYDLRRVMGSLTAESLGLANLYNAEALSDRDASRWIDFGE